MKIAPISLVEANAFVAVHHRHSEKVTGHKFAIGLVSDNNELIGVAIVGRPTSKNLDEYRCAEVTRVCTLGDKNACSKLYGAARRACAAMGYEKVYSYTLGTESGASLRAAGFHRDGVVKRKRRVDRRTGVAKIHPGRVRYVWP